MNNRDRINQKRIELTDRKESAIRALRRARGYSVTFYWNRYADAADKLSYIDYIIEQYAV